MRLWHQQLISFLPRQQLLGQHRECCALRGNGWQKKHATVQYVFGYSAYKLYQYHCLVMQEMEKRGYTADVRWHNHLYRGRNCNPYKNLPTIPATTPIYKEHNSVYLQECLQNLEQKGILISME